MDVAAIQHELSKLIERLLLKYTKDDCVSFYSTIGAAGILVRAPSGPYNYIHIEINNTTIDIDIDDNYGPRTAIALNDPQCIDLVLFMIDLALNDTRRELPHSLDIKLIFNSSKHFWCNQKISL